MESVSENPRLLILVDWFIPGFRAGGPIRSISNLIDAIHKDVDIYLITLNTDAGIREPYEGIETNKWVDYNQKASVLYLPFQKWQLTRLRIYMKNIEPDVIYLNGMFSFQFTLMPLLWKWTGFLSTAKWVLVPRGMLRNSALQFKPMKKRIALFFIRQIGLLRRVYFQATDDQEVYDIRQTLKIDIRSITRIANFGRVNQHPLTALDKKKTEVKLLYLGRVHPIKNLLTVIEVLCKSGFSGDLKLSVCGPIEDPVYWASCQKKAQNLPKNIRLEYLGQRSQSETDQIIQQHHALVLFTSGENFAHSVFEAFCNGRPVIISDQTPWKGLQEKSIGWDIPIEKAQGMNLAIAELAEMDSLKYHTMCEKAWAFAASHISHSDQKAMYLQLFSV